MRASFHLFPLHAAAIMMSGTLLFPLSSMGEEGLAILHAPAIHYPVTHDVSPPLREIKPLPPQAGPPRVIPLRAIPHTPFVSSVGDPVMQSSPGPSIATTSGINVDGVSDSSQGAVSGYLVAPPDTNGAVGASQYVQWVNLAFAVFDKNSGAKIYGPAAGNTMWAGFGADGSPGGLACQNNNSGDPVVQYDKAAGRWIMTQPVFSGPPYYQCVAVSQTSDATGAYNRYAYLLPNFNDYPKLGVWPDGYYLSFNMFQGNSFVGARACVLDRIGMLNGAAAAMQCFQLGSGIASLLPADLDGSTPPPAGSPGYFLNFGSNSLNLWQLHVDWATPANSTFTGPATLPVAAFSEACNGGTCIPQGGTKQKLDSLGDRLMYRLAYRNFTDHEALVVNHSVSAGRSVGVRWYEVRGPFATNPTVYQQGTYAPDANFRWMGSIAMDQAGDIALGYSVSSGSMHPAIRYTGRVPTDALGTLESEKSIVEGTGSQTRNLSRWGDYSSLSIDPVDDCTFWYTNEYLKSNGNFNWSTRIGSFRFPNCP